MDNLKLLLGKLKEAEEYEHASKIIEFDMETKTPTKGLKAQGELQSLLANKAYEITHSKEFVDCVVALHKELDSLETEAKVLVSKLYKDIERKKNISPELNLEFSNIENEAFANWVEAKKDADFTKFAPSLAKIKDMEFKKIALNESAVDVAYDNLLDIYEPGMTSAKLDELFGECKESLIPLLEKIKAAKKPIRTDFASRKVKDYQQEEFMKFLLETLGFDFNRGTYALSEHPFTELVGRNDERVTTHFYEDNLFSSMYSVIHECGHALFDLSTPDKDWDYYLFDYKSMGQHESVSRFYENIIGRSENFIAAIYDRMQDIFPEALKGVSKTEIFDYVNQVQPSLVRTEADEFTYTFHIIIRYEIEKEIMEGKLDIADVPKAWAKKYKSYLGVTPTNDTLGCLQDVHWTSGFGYFPTYALGNFYNSMYYNKMKEEIDVADAIRTGHMDTINKWMFENVWKDADKLDSSDWIKQITTRELTSMDFLEYIENKYGMLYGL